jgi:NADH-quinone oxidoreductase subunit H
MGEWTVMQLILVTLAKAVAILLLFVMVIAALLTFVERKLPAFVQNRIGPNRANFGRFRFGGLLHLIADSVKMLIKEDFIPDTPNRWLYVLGPFLAFVPPLFCFIFVPFGPPVGGYDPFRISPSGLGILFLFAILSLGVYGATLGAWASNNKWSLLGGIRIAAQMVSYEVTMGLNLVGVFLIYQSVDLQQIVIGQGDYLFGVIPKWGIVTQPVAFILFLTASIAANKRAPFDVAEAESELVAGYWTEYSALKFGLFALSEFVEIILVAAVAATLFFGGWQIPYLSGTAPWIVVLQVGAFIVKTLVLVWLQFMIRWTFPRFRYDQVMRLGWRVLLPVSLLNLFVTGLVVTFVERA